MVDATIDHFVFEFTGRTDKVEQFIAIMAPLGLVEVCRTGIAALSRGREGWTIEEAPIPASSPSSAVSRMARIRPSARRRSRPRPGLVSAKAENCSGVSVATVQSRTAQAPAERGPPSKKDCSPTTEPGPNRASRPKLKPSLACAMTSTSPSRTMQRDRSGVPRRITASPAAMRRKPAASSSRSQSASLQFGKDSPSPSAARLLPRSGARRSPVPVRFPAPVPPWSPRAIIKSMLQSVPQSALRPYSRARRDGDQGRTGRSMGNFVLLGACFLLGILLRWSGRLPDNAAATLNGFVVNISLPALTLTYVHGLKLDTTLILPALMAWIMFGDRLRLLLCRRAVLPLLARHHRRPDADRRPRQHLLHRPADDPDLLRRGLSRPRHPHRSGRLLLRALDPRHSRRLVSTPRAMRSARGPSRERSCCSLRSRPSCWHWS